MIAAAIGAVSQRSEIDNLNSKNETLATGKATAIQQREAAQRRLDAAQQAFDDRAAQDAVHEADEQKIEALRPPGATLFAAQCASCHGPEGDGGIGLRLSGGAVAQHLSPEAAVAFVSNGAFEPCRGSTSRCHPHRSNRWSHT